MFWREEAVVIQRFDIMYIGKETMRVGQVFVHIVEVSQENLTPAIEQIK